MIYYLLLKSRGAIDNWSLFIASILFNQNEFSGLCEGAGLQAVKINTTG